MRVWGLCLLVLALAGCGGQKAVGVVTTTTPSPPGSAAPTPRKAPRPAKGAAPWPAPAQPMKLTVKAGLTPETHEFVFLHVHAHLDVFVNGVPVVVPAGIGIDIANPAVKRFRANDGRVGYGGINPACAKPCISPLHTHFPDGILHTEARVHQFNTLGEFFTEWNVRLNRRCVGGYCKPTAPVTVYVDGSAVGGDPRRIELGDGQEIAIVIGSPPATIPSRFG